MKRTRIKRVRKLDPNPIYKVYVLRRTDKMDEHEPDKYQPLYFGKGKDKRELYHRWYALRTIDKGGNRRSVYVMIYKLWREGFDFIEEVLFDNLTEQEAFDIEISAIAFYGRMDNGTGILANHTDGGDGVCGFVWSEEAKKERSRRYSGENHPNYGKPMSEKQKEFLSNLYKGKPLSEKRNKAIREAQKGENHPRKGKTFSEKSRKQMSESHMGLFAGKNHPNYGIPVPEERKERIRKSLTGRKHSEETIRKRAEAIKKSWERRRNEKT